jgi:hypothetical protein
MTPQERARVTELFDRLSTLESNRRDPDAERLIAQSVSRAPNALYALVQTVLLQDEALKEAERRLRETDAPDSGSGFLDPLRRQGSERGSVPSVSAQSKWNNGGAIPRATEAPAVAAPYPQPGGQGSSFLGTAAAAALGFVGGNLLFGALRNMTGGQPSAFGSPDSNTTQRGPWTDASQGELARDAGLNDIGGSGSREAGRSAGLFGNADDSRANDTQPDDGPSFADNSFDDDNGFDDDFGDMGSGDA